MKLERYNATNIAELTIDGPITKDEIQPVLDELDAMIDEHGTIRLVEVITHIGRVEPGALWADLKWEPRHLKHFSHVAIVADEKWVEWMIKPLDMLISAKLKLFHLDEIDAVRTWIRTVGNDR